MKKVNVLIIALVFLTACGITDSSGIGKRKIAKEAESKVEKMQELIEFSNEQIFKLKKMEVAYLNEITKVNHCDDCNKELMIKEIDEKRDIQLQNILTREQYIKYDAIDKERIKYIEPRAE